MHIQVLPDTMILLGTILTTFVIIAILAALEDVIEFVIDLIYKVGA